MDEKFDEISRKFMEFANDSIPDGFACVFAVAEDRETILAVLGGQEPDSDTFDALLVKLASHVDQRRDCDKTSVSLYKDEDPESYFPRSQG